MWDKKSSRRTKANAIQARPAIGYKIWTNYGITFSRHTYRPQPSSTACPCQQADVAQRVLIGGTGVVLSDHETDRFWSPRSRLQGNEEKYLGGLSTVNWLSFFRSKSLRWVAAMKRNLPIYVMARKDEVNVRLIHFGCNLNCIVALPSVWSYFNQLPSPLFAKAGILAGSLCLSVN